MEPFFLFYGVPFLKGFFITTLLLTALLFLYQRYSFFRIRKGSTHHTPSPALRLGGGTLIVGFLLALWQIEPLFFPLSWWVFFAVLLCVLIVGVWDDIKSLRWQFQLGVQAFLLSLLYLGGVEILSITNPGGGVFLLESGSLFTVSFLLFLAWGLLVLNAVNWLDGVDGLCGSVMTVTYLALFFLSLSPVVSQPALALLLVVALGSVLGFMVYNYPPARLIAGTAGSLFFGIVIVFVSVVAGTKIATTLLILSLPIVDTVFVLAKRIREKRSIFAPDQGHLHHLLRKRGWSDRSIVFSYVFLTGMIGIIAIHTQALGKLLSIVSVFGILGIVYFALHFQKRISDTILLIVGALISVVFLVFLSYALYFAPVRNIWIGKNWYQAEVAATLSERERGLSGREQPCLRCGMIFIFPKPEVPLFWMKDMRFSIDILWVYKGRVVAKNENLPFPSLQTWSPSEPVDMVIELPAGTARSIPVGAKIHFW